MDAGNTETDMSQRRREIQVGATFLVAVVILLAGVMWFKEFQVGGEYRRSM